MFHKVKPLVWLAIGSVLFSVLTTFIWFNVNNSHDGFAVGMITEARDGAYTIEDPRKGEVTVVTSKTTRIKYLHNSDETLLIGDFVQVNGDFMDTTLKAKSIRVMRPPKNAPPPPNQIDHDDS